MIAKCMRVLKCCVRIGVLITGLYAFLPLHSFAQSLDIVRVSPSSAVTDSPSISLLDGARLNIRKVKDLYYFTPAPLVDWKLFSNSVEEQCKSTSGDLPLEVTAPLSVLFYNDEITGELSQALKASSLKIVPVEYWAMTVFVDTVDGRTQVYSDLSNDFGIGGYKISAGKNPEKARKFFLTGDCEFLFDVANRKYLTVLYHALAQEFEESLVTAAVVMEQNIERYVNASDKATETQKTILSATSNGGGANIDLGIIKLAGVSSSGTATTEVKNYRAVNRSWLSSVRREISQDISINEICEGELTCDSAGLKLIEKLVEDNSKAFAVELTFQSNNS